MEGLIIVLLAALGLYLLHSRKASGSPTTGTTGVATPTGTGHTYSAYGSREEALSALASWARTVGEYHRTAAMAAWSDGEFTASMQKEFNGEISDGLLNAGDATIMYPVYLTAFNGVGSG